MVSRPSAFVRTIALTLTVITTAGPTWAKGPSGGAAIAVGDLAVETDPYGAAVFVDGRAAGATPITVSGLTAGEHRVRVVKKGYLENARVITVVAGKPTAVKVKLTRAGETATEAGQVTSSGGGGGGLFSNKWLWIAAAGAGVAAVAVLATRNAAPSPGTITAPASALQGVNVRFSSTGSSDPDGDALTLSWDFGDGGTGTGTNPTHAYTRTGSFTVTLTVSDDKHKVTAPSLTVNVKNLTATWRGPLRGGTTTFNSVVPLTQNGNNLSGSYTDQTPGTGAVSGSIDPGTGSVTFTVTVPGITPWTFTGTVDGDVNNLNGVANGSGFNSAPWTMSRG